MGSRKLGFVIIIIALVAAGLTYWSIRKNQTLFESRNLAVENNLYVSTDTPPAVSEWLNEVKEIDITQNQEKNGGGLSQSPAPSEQLIGNPEDYFQTNKVSKEAIFNRLWPAVYIERLKEWQSMMIADGFLKENEKKDFKNSEEIYAFLEKSIDYWISIDVIKEEEKDQKAAGIEKLKQLKQLEAESFIGKMSQSNIDASVLQSRCEAMRMRSAFLKNLSLIFKPIISVFSFTKEVLSANSTSSIPPSFIMCPDCWKLGAGVGPVCGASLWAPCCKCYCGTKPCGCLNAVCVCCNAIWDCATGICGCDIIGGC